jgi:hypothetical protein
MKNSIVGVLLVFAVFTSSAQEEKIKMQRLNFT